jgi:hypothetical protein
MMQRQTYQSILSRQKLANPYIGGYGEREVVLMKAQPKQTKIIFGTAAGRLGYKEEQTNQVDADIQEMFYGKDWDKS